MIQPKVSVIIPCYKVEKYLDRCVESVINQTLKDLEIILVDDESPDHVPEICDEWALKDARIKVIHKKNGGLGMACNSGIEVATGKYVAFLDSDDWIDANMYQTMYDTAEKHQAQMVFTGLRRVDTNGNVIGYLTHKEKFQIYEGKNEPSRNEFDLDYNGYLAEQKRMGKLDAAGMERLKTDCWEKTKYEMDNMFVSTNRATYGKVSTFCPILSKHDMVQEAEKMLVTAERIEEAIKKVREVDYSLFYREVIFSDPMHGVNAEPVQKEVFPDVILMPNVGMKAMMWQETAGVKRDTSARCVFPVMMIETCGRFRWEMCRKIQGMRWNDITEKSLTSEYCDYIQYYRKNRDLSTEAKEKIKNTLWKSKNNYREVFISDYIGWIKYEAGGSFRLNRVARDILFRYCPFAKKYRDALEANPMYQDMISRFKIFQERKLRHIDGFRTRYEKNGGEMNMELQENMNFYNM